MQSWNREWRPEHIEDYLAEYLPDLKRFLKDECSRSLWEPRPTQLMRSNPPDMLLYRLGSLCDISPPVRKRFESLSSGIHHCVITNGTGTGKTRLILEVLSARWGFYLTCRTSGKPRCGSIDLWYHLNLFTPSDLDDCPLAVQSDLHASNQKHMSAITLALAVSRFAIFNWFCEATTSLGLAESDARRLWVLFQLRPAALIGTDLFDTVSRQASLISRPSLDAYFRQLQQACQFQPEIVVVDDAEPATRLQSNSFLTSSHQYAPALFGIVRGFADTLPHIRVFTVGTRLDVDMVRDAVQHSTSASKHIEAVHDLGTFDDFQQTIQYVEHFLGPLDETRRLSIYSTFRGRYRFVASVVEKALAAGVGSLERVMAEVAEHFSDPSDTSVYDRLPRPFCPDNDRIAMSYTDVLREAMMGFYLRGQVYSTRLHAARLVGYGSALFSASGLDAQILEPLIFLRLHRWYRATMQHAKSTLKRPAQTHDLRLKECALTLSVDISIWLLDQLGFRDPMRGTVPTHDASLTSLLDFGGNIPSWLEGSASITLPLAYRRAKDQNVKSTTHSVAAATTVEDVTCWLVSGDTAFLIPDNAMGVDLMFFIRLHDAQRNVLVCLQLDSRSESSCSFYPANPEWRACVESCFSDIGIGHDNSGPVWVYVVGKESQPTQWPPRARLRLETPLPVDERFKTPGYHYTPWSTAGHESLDARPPSLASLAVAGCLPECGVGRIVLA